MGQEKVPGILKSKHYFSLFVYLALEEAKNLSQDYVMMMMMMMTVNIVRFVAMVITLFTNITILFCRCG